MIDSIIKLRLINNLTECIYDGKHAMTISPGRQLPLVRPLTIDRFETGVTTDEPESQRSFFSGTRPCKKYGSLNGSCSLQYFVFSQRFILKQNCVQIVLR